MNKNDFIPQICTSLPPPTVHSIEFATPKAIEFMDKNKLKIGDQFWLIDNDVRVKATISVINGATFALIHWGTQEDVVFRG